MTNNSSNGILYIGRSKIVKIKHCSTNLGRTDAAMRLTDIIEQILQDQLAQGSGEVQISRNDLAQQVGCVPSQINYVIQTRFTTERGYIVESRRGGGGFIKIQRIDIPSSEYIMHVINSVGDTLDLDSSSALIGNMYEYELISERELRIILAALSNKSLPFPKHICDGLRAEIFKNILANLI